MKLIYSALLAAFCALSPAILLAQPCSVTDASGCDCLDGSNDCDLLPDIQISRDLLLDGSAMPEIAGELGVSVSSPNTGHGPLRVIATDYFVCDDDTIYSPGGYSGNCPDGSAPRQLIYQRIYHKNPSGAMSYYDRWAGSMTYHESHGHMHVDDWGVYSLREEVPGTDPTTWPIVAEGAKLGFCLMDYGSCNYYYGHCRDAADNILTTDAPNYGLGGGGYSCGLYNQGISAGWTDIYYHYLDGMQIPIPPTVCNGDYMLVVEIDPNNNFLEESDDNNVMVVPITLTEQTSGAGFEVEVVDGASTTICQGDMVELSVPFESSGGYTWSNGDTTRSIMVTEAGAYNVTVHSPICGDIVSSTLVVSVNSVDAPSASDQTLMESGTATLTASGSTGDYTWFDAEVGGTELGTGASYTTPTLTTSTSYWVEAKETFPGASNFSEPHNHLSSSQYSGNQYNSYIVFDAHSSFMLKSVKVYTDLPGDRIIEIRDDADNVLHAKAVTVPMGESRIDLDFMIAPGTDLRMGTNLSSNMTNFGHESPRFQRSNSGVSYPYETPGVVTLKDSEYGTDYYYYFYDWEIEGEDQVCPSPRAEARVTVETSTGLEAAIFNGNPELVPNPASDMIKVSFGLNGAQDVSLRAVDLAGRVLIDQHLGNLGGQVQHDLVVSDLAPGTYVLEIHAGTSIVRQQLIIQR